MITIIVSTVAGVIGGIILIALTPLISVRESETDQPQIVQQSENQFWIEFAIALENADTAYLTSHSLDSIKCAECSFIEDQEPEYYKSEFVFNDLERIKKLMHLNSLLDANYSIIEGDELVRINYKIKSKMASEGGYNLIFKFVKINEEKRFAGMVIT